MKMLLSCFECGSDALLTFIPLEYNDTGRYDVTCPKKGHRFIVTSQSHKFEILFDYGAHAILDGYYRDAVSSFSASMERFHEFAIRCLLLRSGISPEAIATAWKAVASQSERQLGAFVLLWANHFGEAPEVLKPDDVKFRNDVIHKGELPSREKAISYGNTVLDVVRPQMRILKTDFADEVNGMVDQHLRSLVLPDDAGVRRVTYGGGSILVLSHAESPDTPLETHLERMSDMLRRFDASLKASPVLVVDAEGKPAPMFPKDL